MTRLVRPRRPAARRLFRPVLLTALALVACGGGGGGSRGGGPGEIAVGDPAPDFRLASLDGATLGPGDFAGQVVVLDFWATWCVPCRMQAAILEPLAAEYGGRGVRFLAVDLGESEETVRRYVADHPFPYPVLLDVDDGLSYELGIYGLPTLMVIDLDGEVSFVTSGVVDGDAVRQALERAGAA
jgi:thiol-disulfide isomerase/thioredoxin